MGIAHKVQKNMSDSLADKHITNLIDAITECQKSAQLPLIDQANTTTSKVQFICDDGKDDVDTYLGKAFGFSKTKKLYKYVEDAAAMDNFCMITSGIVNRSYRYNTKFNADANGSADGNAKIACFDVNEVPTGIDSVINTQVESKFTISKGFIEFQDTISIGAESHLVWYKNTDNMEGIFGAGTKAEVHDVLAPPCESKGNFQLVETHFIGTDNLDGTFTATIDSDSNLCPNYNPSGEPYCYVGWSCDKQQTTTPTPEGSYESLYEAIVGCSPLGPEIDENNTDSASISFNCSTIDITNDDTQYDKYLTEAFKTEKLDALKTYMAEDKATMDNFCILTSALVEKKYRYDLEDDKCGELGDEYKYVHPYVNTGEGIEGITLVNFFEVNDLTGKDLDTSKFYDFFVAELGAPYIFHDAVWFFYESDNMKAIHGQEILTSGNLDDILAILPCDGDGEEFVEAVYHGEYIKDNHIDTFKVTKLEDDSITCTYNPNNVLSNTLYSYCYKRYECMVPPTKPPQTTEPSTTTTDPNSTTIISSCLMILSLSALFL